MSQKILLSANRLSISNNKTSKMRNPKAANSKKNKVCNSNVTQKQTKIFCYPQMDFQFLLIKHPKWETP
jgi:hypothetical protein